MPAAETLLVNVRRVVPAPRDRVFDAWTSPEEIKRWWARPPGYSIPDVTVDLRTGGSYSIEMLSPEGERDRITGEYHHVAVPERLVYTWRWDSVEDRTTQVTVLFNDLGSNTEVVITHGSFGDEPDRDRHADGWEMCLDQIELLVTS